MDLRLIAGFTASLVSCPGIDLGLGRMCPGMPIPGGKAWGVMQHESKTHRRAHC